MRILLIDASVPLRQQCAQYLSGHWPGAELQCTDAVLPQRTRAGDGPGGLQCYDALLLENRPGDGSGNLPSALAWLQQWQERVPGLPPAIVLCDQGGEDLAVQAIKLGAAGYLRQDKLTPERLTGAINDAILERAKANDRALALARLGASGANGAPVASGGVGTAGAPRARRAGEQAEPAVAPTVAVDVGTIGVAAASDAPRINGYRLLRMIGTGGTSKVFLAERLPRLGQPAPAPAQVVLKILDAHLMNGFFIERFIREYRIISAVQNEHVSRIYDQGVTDEHVYIAMEYFPGGDLRARLGSRKDANGVPRLSSMQTLKIVTQVARALDAIHSAGVIHRDLKPNNIMFRQSGHLALVDFGVAKQISEHTITATGALIATPLYMSPEQCLGKPQDARSDLYSLGVMLYEMFTGQPLFSSDNLAAIAFSHVHGEIPRLPPALTGYQSLMDRLLAKNPHDRFQSARELFGYIAY